jgi:phage-related tail protein
MIPFLRPLRLLKLVLIVAALQKAFGDAVRGRIVVYTAATAAQIDELRARIAQLTGLLTEAAGNPLTGAGAAATTPRATH